MGCYWILEIRRIYVKLESKRKRRNCGGGKVKGQSITTLKQQKQSGNNWGIERNDGLKINWGFLQNANVQTTNFAIPFTDTNYGITANSIDSKKEDLYAIEIEKGTASAVFRANYNAQNRTVSYIAIGY